MTRKKDTEPWLFYLMVAFMVGIGIIFGTQYINGNLEFKKPEFDKLINGCDIFWFPNLNFLSVSHQCRTIITVHDLSFEKIPWAYSQKMRFWHKAIRPWMLLQSAGRITAVSQNTKNDLIALYQLPAEKIEVIYPGPAAAISGATADLKLPEKFILCLGTLEPRKNIESVIKAFIQLNCPDLSLVIAGQRGWLYRKIFKTAGQSIIKDKIIFLNYVKAADRQALYQKALALVWPSFYEGFGLPPLEAMANGCPVITSANSSLPEVVGSAALLVDPYNIQEITKSIKQIISDNKLRQSLISQGYKQAEKFSWQLSARKMLEIFNHL